MLQEIFAQFETEGTFHSAEPYGSGHINDTFLVRTEEKHYPDYILRRINHRIFNQPQALMQNISLVTQHIRNKLSKVSDHNLHRQCLTVINSINQEPILLDNEGGYWSCYLYINDSQAHDIVKNAKQAQEGGKLIGRFLNLLSDFPGTLLHETLPQFHNVEFRLNNFEKAVAANTHDRAKHCHNEIDFVRALAEEMKLVMSLGKQGRISLRVVHNDTKFNNVLLDNDDNGLCVIDLDTVMPGYVHYDFSDAVRTIANSAAEDEQDLSKIQFDLPLFAAFCRGFLGELKNSLNADEVNSLARAAPLMPYLHGTRMLTDYLSGDQYYKIHFPEHNLQRARAQFQLIRRMREKLGDMEKIILEVTSPFAWQ